MSERGVSKLFVMAMEDGLHRGRLHGRKGWDERWSNYPNSSDALADMLVRLDEEVIELSDDPSLKEAADVANIAMMIADIVRVL